jgi:hypothetical protein
MERSWRGGFLNSNLVEISPMSLFQLGHGRAGSVGCTNDQAHTGPGDAVNWHVQLLDHLEHADVSGASRAAAREHQADLRSIRGVGVRRGLGCGGLRGPCGEQKTNTCEQDTVGQSGHEAVLNGIGAIDAGKTRRFASHRRQGNYAWLRLAVPRTTLRSVFAGMMDVSVASKVMSKIHSTKAGTLRLLPSRALREASNRPDAHPRRGMRLIGTSSSCRIEAGHPRGFSLGGWAGSFS